MCMEDIRLGRQMGASETNPLCGVTSTVLVSADSNRVALTIYPPTSGTVTISTIDPVVATVGIILSPGDHPIHYNIKDDGRIVTKGFWGIHSVGGVTICCHESRLEVQ